MMFRNVIDMKYTNEQLNWVYDRTRGYCFYCGIRISFKNYGKVGERGAWEVDHFIPKASRGAHQPFNWVPACIDCNTRKTDLLPWHYDSNRFEKGIRDPDYYM